MMTDKLPKGTFKPLAKIVGPVTLWMSGGWLLYPVLVEDIYVAIGETVDVEEVRLFSYIMVAVCIGVGLLLMAYGFTGQKINEAEFAIINPAFKCPYCSTELAHDAATCLKCNKRIPR